MKLRDSRQVKTPDLMIIPMIDIINRPATTKTGFPHHWHTQKDDLNAIEPLTLHAVGTVLIKLLYLEDVDKI